MAPNGEIPIPQKLQISKMTSPETQVTPDFLRSLYSVNTYQASSPNSSQVNQTTLGYWSLVARRVRYELKTAFQLGRHIIPPTIHQRNRPPSIFP